MATLAAAVMVGMAVTYALVLGEAVLVVVRMLDVADMLLWQV